MLDKTNKKSLSLNKETISVLDETTMDNVKGGTNLAHWINVTHVVGDHASWWHCDDKSEHDITD